MKSSKRFILGFLAAISICSFNKMYGAKKSPTFIEYIIQNGILNERSVDKNGATPFLIAIRANENNTGKLLMTQGASIFAKDYSGQNAIHYAAMGNNAYMIQVLGQSVDADIESFKQKETPLIVATRCGHQEAVEELLKIESVRKKIDTADLNGNTAFLVALNQGSLVLAEVLLNAGSNVMVINHSRLTPLLITLDFMLKNPAQEEQCLGILRKIIAKVNDADYVNIPNPQNGWTSLHYAAQMKSDELIDLLLKKDANKNAKTPGGICPYILASAPEEEAVNPEKEKIVNPELLTKLKPETEVPTPSLLQRVSGYLHGTGEPAKKVKKTSAAQSDVHQPAAKPAGQQPKPQDGKPAVQAPKPAGQQSAQEAQPQAKVGQQPAQVAKK